MENGFSDNENKKDIQNELNLVFQELKEDPYRRFDLAFALMSIIPLLVFFYLLVTELSTIDVLIGKVGFILILTIVIAIMGYYLGYLTIRNILAKVISYATAAKHSDRLKSVFVATASHELKNPVAILKGNIYNVMEGFLGDVNEQQKKVLQLCYDVLQRMTRLVTGLLDVYKMEDKMVGLVIGKCDLNMLVEKQVKELGAMIDEKELVLEKNLPEKKIIAWIDENKIEQVIHNIISNAIKYTPNKGSIELSLSSSNNFVEFECKDSGVGIPQDKLEKIFDKFVRLIKAKEGTGLGLAITKELVELHNGKVSAESQPGQGSKFTVILPQDLRKLKGE